MSSMNSSSFSRSVPNKGMGTFFIILVWVLASLAPAKAESLKWRQTMHVIKAESIEVGDVPAHIVGLAHVGGLASFENGEIAPISLKSTFDYTNGSGQHQGYVVYTFEDEATFVIKYQGTTTAASGGKVSTFKGDISFIQGSGRFTGIKGSGTYTGKRFAPLSTGAEFYYDFETTYTVPTRFN